MLLKARTVKRWGLTTLELTRVGGKTVVIDAPFPPYFYVPRALNVGFDQGVYTKTFLSDMQKRTLHKISFHNVEELKFSRVDDCIDADIPYDQRVAIDLGFDTQSVMPSIGAWDMEMESHNGMFPDARVDRCTAISYCSDKSAECKTLNDTPEYEMFEWLFDKFERENIDLPTDYFGARADMLWAQQRCEALNIPFRMGRDGSAPYLKIRKFNMGKKIGEDWSWDIQGRVHFDLFKEVIQDQSLFGIKNRQLKTLAEWFGIPVIRVDRARLATLTPEELHDYCLSDARATYKLAKIYVRNLVPLTERLHIAFNMTVNRSPSHVSNYIYAREFNELGIVADKNNNARYPEFGYGYQAALVDLFEPCFIEEDLGHVDFNSMYPSNFMCFNYSPENFYDYKFVQQNVDFGRDYSNSVKFNGNQISVYDSKLQGWIVLRVKLDKPSVTKRLLIDMCKERKQLKTEMKNARSEEEREILNSQQWCVKVLMNSIPGYNGMGYAKYGCFPINAQCVGEGRWEISHATNFVKSIGYTPIQRHTDGLYFKGSDCSKELTAYIQSLIPEQFDRDVIGVGFNKYTAGIFYETNGYILLDKTKPKPKDIIYHSSGVKGHHLPKVCDKALDAVVRGVFTHDDVIGLLHSVKRMLKDCNLEDFLMTVKVSKEPDAYNSTNQYAKMIQKARACGIQIRWGDEFQYVKTREYDYMPLGALHNKSYTIDYDYYIERIAGVLERPLRVTHNLSEKQILYALRGYIVTPPKPTKQTRLRRMQGVGHVDYKDFMIM